MDVNKVSGGSGISIVSNFFCWYFFFFDLGWVELVIGRKLQTKYKEKTKRVEVEKEEGKFQEVVQKQKELGS